jgi:hypothetical protein
MVVTLTVNKCLKIRDVLVTIVAAAKASLLFTVEERINILTIISIKFKPHYLQIVCR